MSDTTHGGKGSKRRPTDADRYNNNYDRIFCQKGNQPTIEEKIQVDHLDYNSDVAWSPACGGTERPFEWAGKEYLYMYNHVTGEHSYYNATDDVFEPNVEFN